MTTTKWALTGQTLTGFTKGYDGNKGLSDPFQRWRFRVVDFANLKTRLIKYDSTYTNFAQNDIFALIPLANGEFVERAAYAIEVATNAGVTATFGDQSTLDKFFGSTALDAAAGTMGHSSVTMSVTAQDAFCMKITSATVPTTGQLKVAALVSTPFPELSSAAL